MDFGEFLKEQRQAKNISIYRLSKLTNIAWSQLAGYAKGRNSPTIKNAEKICKALQTIFVIR